MGERKAVNKYYPPDWDPSKGGLDKYHGVHPLRERASKLHLGIMVIRFEMPFNIWCGGCNNHIGMGVRYNAEKKKIGMYYTTPIWQFRMKCHLCDNYIEMHTDPKNFDYIVASGGRRKEERYDQNDAECAAAHEAEERKRLSTDPMFKLQYQNKDEAVVDEAAPIIDKLQERQDAWKDDYQINQTLRKRHREDTKSDKAANLVLKKNMGLDIKMLPTTKSDKITSSFVRFSREKEGLKLEKRSEIASIFCDKKAKLLTSLKQSGVKCSGIRDDLMIGPVKKTDLVTKVSGKKRRRSTTDSSVSSSQSSESSKSSESQASHESSAVLSYSRRLSEPCHQPSIGDKRNVSSEPSINCMDKGGSDENLEQSESEKPPSSSLVSGYSSSESNTE